MQHLIIENSYTHINCYRNLIFIGLKSDPGIEATKVYLMRTVCIHLFPPMLVGYKNSGMDNGLTKHIGETKNLKLTHRVWHGKCAWVC